MKYLFYIILLLNFSCLSFKKVNDNFPVGSWKIIQMRYIESNSVITGGKIIFYNNGKFNFIDSTGNMEFGKWITYENKHITLIYDFEPETPIEFSEFELFENCIRLTCHKDFLIVYELCKLQ